MIVSNNEDFDNTYCYNNSANNWDITYVDEDVRPEPDHDTQRRNMQSTMNSMSQTLTRYLQDRFVETVYGRSPLYDYLSHQFTSTTSDLNHDEAEERRRAMQFSGGTYIQQAITYESPRIHGYHGLLTNITA